MPPELTLVTGPPGAGKTTFAAARARRTGALRLGLDTVSEPIVRAALRALGRDPDDRDSPFYKATFRAPIYDALLAIAAENLAAGHPVVIDAPFTRELTQPDWPDRLAAELGCPVHVCYLTAAPSVLRARLEARRNPRDAGKLADWDQHLAAYPAPRCRHERIETDSLG